MVCSFSTKDSSFWSMFLFFISIFFKLYFFNSLLDKVRQFKTCGHTSCFIVSLSFNRFPPASCADVYPYKKVTGVASPLGTVSFLNAPGACLLDICWESSVIVELFLVTWPCISASHPLIIIVVNVQDIWSLLWSLRCEVLPFYLVFLREGENP